MTIVRDSISSAYREINVTPIGIVPNTAQLAEGLLELNKLLCTLFGSQMGELLADWETPFSQRTAPVAANFPQNPYPSNQDSLFMGAPLSAGDGANIWPYPPKNSRIVFGATQDTTVFFPEQPDDGSRMGVIQGSRATNGVILTLDGNGRTIDGAATQALTVPLTRQRWIYRADLGDWRPIASLGLDDELPFPEDVDDFIDLKLAVRLAPKNDKTISPETTAALKQAQIIFEARYKQSGTTTYGASNIPQGYESYQSGRYWW